MNWNSRPLVLTALGILLTAMNAMGSTPPTDAVTKPLQFTSGSHIVGFTSKDVVVATGSHALRIEFVGAQRVEPIAAGTAAPDGKAASLTRVTYQGIWAGISLAYDAPEGQLRSTYTIAPGADAAMIRLRYNAPVTVEPGGGLRIAFLTGAMSESAPIAWQEREGRRVAVAVTFRKASDFEVGFALGPYDKDRPLTIDPTSTWNTFLGGTQSDVGLSIARDGSGNVYVTGYSNGTWGDPISPWAGKADAFVAKLDTNGMLVWNTFLGAAGYDYFTGDDVGYGIAVDAYGNVLVAGVSANSWGVPIRAFAGSLDVFVAKLDPNGVLLWNTFLGETAYSNLWFSIAVDASGDVFVAGSSSKTWGSPIRAFVGQLDAFVARLDTNGVLLWNTFLGGASRDEVGGIAVDANGNVIVAGSSSAAWGVPIHPWVAGAVYVSYANAFIAKIEGNGSLLWNTFLEGSNWGNCVAVDGSDNIYVETGQDTVANRGVAKLDSNGTPMWKNTFVATGSVGTGIAVDTSSNVFVSGSSSRTWGDPIHAFAGGSDGFVVRLDSDGVLMGNTFLGVGLGPISLAGISLDAGVAIYVTGTGAGDAFVAKLGEIVINNAPPVAYDMTLTTPENTWMTITSAAMDTDGADGDTVVYTLVTLPAHGTVYAGSGMMVYYPAADYTGPDSFTFKATDGIADSNIAVVSITVTADTTPPTGSVLINDGAVSTGTTSVTLNLSAADPGGTGIAYMRFSNDGVNWSVWYCFTPTWSWTLTNAVGAKTVYVLYQDYAGNISDSDPLAEGYQGYKDTIVLTDTFPPTGSILIDNGATSTTTTAVVLYLSAVDTGGSGLGWMRIRNANNPKWPDWETFSATRAWTLDSAIGGKSVLVQYKDMAGNISDADPLLAGNQVYRDTIILKDPFPPTGSILINNGAASTTTTAVTLYLSADDTGGSGLGGMRFRNANNPKWTDWETFSATRAWTLDSVIGGKSVLVQYKDMAGNISDADPLLAGNQVYKDTIALKP